MPGILINIRYEGAVPGPNLSPGALSNILKKAWYEPGKNLHENFRPKHFTQEGAREYGYAPRRGEESGTSGKAFWRSYTGRKLKKFGHTLPLVYSGDLRDRTRIARIDSKADGVRVVLPQANKANFHNPKSNVNMREELTRISADEARQSAELLDQAVRRRIAAFNATSMKFYSQNTSPTTSVVGFFHGD